MRTRRGNRHHLHHLPINHGYPGHTEPARVDRDPARIPEKLLAVMHPHDQRIDATQHGIYAVQVCDPALRFLAFGDVAHQGDNRPAVAQALRVAPQFDPCLCTILARPQQLQWFCSHAAGDDRVVGALERCARSQKHHPGLERKQLLARLVQHAAGSVVDMDDAHAGTIDQIDRIRYGVDCRDEALQRFFATLSLGDIQVHHHGAILAVIGQGCHRQQEPALLH